jgi:hypothetical protein
MRRPTLRAAFTLVVAFAAALVLAGCGAGGGSSVGGDGGGEADPSAGVEADGESAELGVPSLGRKDAPVVMTEYSDYQ